MTRYFLVPERVSHEKPNVTRAKLYARRHYSRDWLASYLAALGRSTIRAEQRFIWIIVQKQGQAGLIDTLRDMHRADPGDSVIYGALLAETLSYKRTRAQIYRNAAELTKGVAA